MQFQAQGKPPVGMVFDSDMGTSIDTALALAMLVRLQGKGEAGDFAEHQPAEPESGGILRCVARFSWRRARAFYGAGSIGMAGHRHGSRRLP